MSMPTVTLPDHFSGGHVQRRKQGGRPVSLRVVRALLGQARAEREKGLGAVERLHLGFLRVFWLAPVYNL